jgi:hypothetical protein
MVDCKILEFCRRFAPCLECDGGARIMHYVDSGDDLYITHERCPDCDATGIAPGALEALEKLVSEAVAAEREALSVQRERGK